jgi:uncharacterized protein (UPF0262 family)
VTDALPARRSTPPRLARITVETEPSELLGTAREAERAQAITDLLAEAHFRPVPQAGGAFSATDADALALRLSIAQRRLVFDIRREADDRPVGMVGLALGPFRSIIKDYRMLVDSHIAAVEAGRQDRVQAIDMGRRGLHNEGAALVRERLAGKIEIDMATARRLFTLLCVLHQREGDGTR